MLKFLLSIIGVMLCVIGYTQTPDNEWIKEKRISISYNTTVKPPKLDTTYQLVNAPKFAVYQEDVVGIIASGLDSLRIKEYLSKLTSYTFDGRKQGSSGEKITTDYIKSTFQSNGLKKWENKGYESSYRTKGEKFIQNYLSIHYQPFLYQEDFYAFSKSNDLKTWFETDEVTFLGYGIDDSKYSDYDGVSVEGKIILIYPGEPLKPDSTSYLTNSNELSNWSEDWTKKLVTAKKNGVKGVIFIERNHKFYINRYKEFLDQYYFHQDAKDISKDFSPSIYISQEAASRLIGEDKIKDVVKVRDQIMLTGKSKPVKIPTRLEIVLKESHIDIAGENVAMYLEGSDPKLKDEWIVISAHHDHLGYDIEGLHEGADKNASGTAALLEISNALQLLKQLDYYPKRPILLVSYSSGETGHYGLEHFIKSSGLQNKIHTLINFEALGAVDIEHKTYPYYSKINTSNTSLAQSVSAVNKKYTHLLLENNANIQSTGAFITSQLKIPTVFLTTGPKPFHGKNTDELLRLDLSSTLLRTQFIFILAHELANQ